MRLFFLKEKRKEGRKKGSEEKEKKEDEVKRVLSYLKI